MLGPSGTSLGGIAAVVGVYRRHGLFERWPIRFIATYRDGSPVAKALAALLGLATLLGMLLRRRVSLVHAHSASRSSFWRKSVFLAVALAFRRPVIFHLHGGGFEHFYRNECGPLRQRWVRFVLDRCATIVVVSERWKAVMQTITANPAVTCIANPVQVEAAAGVSSCGSHPLVLFLGRLEEAKGTYVLLDAFAGLHARFPDVRLVLAGHGEVEEVRARVRELGLAAAVDVPGWVGAAEKDRLLRQATVLALPSFAEALPMSILEAMAHGVAVVATPVGAIPEILGVWHCGLMVPVGDVEQLVSTLARLLEDAELRARMGRAGIEAYERDYQADVVVPRLEAIYGSLGAFRDVAACGASAD
jgi:glycosyltransferase involved in cell wall biosynthesis